MKILGILVLLMVIITILLYYKTKKYRQEVEKMIDDMEKNDIIPDVYPDENLNMVDFSHEGFNQDLNGINNCYSSFKKITIAAVIFYIVLLYIM